jgi:hypothetical protein
VRIEPRQVRIGGDAQDLWTLGGGRREAEGEPREGSREREDDDGEPRRDMGLSP